MDPSSRSEPVGSGAPSDAPGGWRRHAGPLAGALLLGLFAYSNSFHGPFVFDDRQYIRDNPLIRDLERLVGDPSWYRAQPNRFLAFVSFALNYRIGGLEVFGFHVVNVAVHLLCAACVYALVALTFRTPRLARSSLAPWSRSIAFAASVLFVAHPLQTQAVTYLVQRITSLATLLYVVAVLLYARWRVAGEAGEWGPARRWATYALALVAAVAAMKTKEIAFTLPFAIVLYELCFFGPRPRRMLALVPFLATSLVIPATLLDLHAGAGVVADVAARTRVETALPRLDYLRTEIAVVAEYLRLLVLPVGQNLDHDFPVERSFLSPRVLASLAILLALVAAAAWLHRRTGPRDARPLDPAARLVSFGIGWFFLTLLVESSVIPIDDVINEHRVYLPSIGFFAAAAGGGALLLSRVRGAAPGRLVALTALLLALVLAVATLGRNAVWGSEVSLWADAAMKSPNKVRPLNNLAPALAQAGLPEEGVLVLRRAVALEPTNAIVRGQLGAALASLRRTADAEVEMREAIRLDPARSEHVFNLALLLSRTGRVEEARTWFRRYLEIAPASAVDMRRFASGFVR
jgi:tetratricopeptide (TPR) repeat protein